MQSTVENPRISIGGLVTVAFLKAQLDAGADHLGMFLPLVLDAAKSFSNSSFATHDVQERLSQLHGIAMPQHVIATLLHRATKQLLLQKDVGRYKTTTSLDTIPPIGGDKDSITESQCRLAERLIGLARARGITISSNDAALDTILRFLEMEQVVVLLGGSSASTSSKDGVTQKEHALVADFIYHVVRNDEVLSSILNRLLEGLVLYHAAFLPDLSVTKRKFKNLRVAFDSSLVRQALGFEGAAAQTLMLETIALLREVDVQCLVFDKTILEIRRLLAVFQEKLATTAGQKSLRYGAMTRHFLTSRLTPGDVHQLSSLLELNIQKVGFAVMPLPKRQRAFTAGEKELAVLLASPDAKPDEMEPRVEHDVDCVAGILVLREGHQATALEEARAVFAADQGEVIRTITKWWREKEHELSLEPVVHVRALANLAWLKKPALASSFKMRELISLCSAALRPSPKTWQRFLRHLEKLNSERSLSDQEMVAVIVSSTSEKLLREAEEMTDDVDATTLDEIVDLVKHEYSEEAEKKIEIFRAEHKLQVEELASDLEVARQAANIADAKRRQTVSVRRDRAIGRAKTWAHQIARIVFWLANLVLALALIGEIHGLLHEDHTSRLRLSFSIAIALFLFIEFTALRSHIRHFLSQFESRLSAVFFDWLDPEAKYDDL